MLLAAAGAVAVSEQLHPAFATRRRLGSILAAHWPRLRRALPTWGVAPSTGTATRQGNASAFMPNTSHELLHS